MEIQELSKSGQYERLSSNDYFSNIALLISQRSTCPRLHVGALIVKNGEILSTGYNGAPKGQPHCMDAGCIIEDGHCIRAIHAEQNAIIQLGHTIQNNDIGELEMYVTDYPCKICAKMIVQAGIKKIHFVRRYSNSVHDEYTQKLFETSGIKIINYYPKKRMFLGTFNENTKKKIRDIISNDNEE